MSVIRKVGSRKRIWRWISYSLLIPLSILLAVQTAYAAEESTDLAAPSHSDGQIYEQLKRGQRTPSQKTYEQPKNPVVYLTFDDGPSKLTPQVLDILAEEKVKATFFVLGEHAEKYPQLLQRIVKEGHAIGNHTYNHVYDELYSSFDMYWKQVQKTEEAIYKATGLTTSLLRAPGGTYGHFDAFYHYYLDQAGYIVHDWNIDTGDARRRGVPAQEIIANTASGALRQEAVVLMHDSTGHEATVEALPEIIQYFRDKGYEFATMTEETKPVQFSLGNLKKARKVTEKQHEAYMAEAVSYRDGRRLRASSAGLEAETEKHLEEMERYAEIGGGLTESGLTREFQASGLDNIVLAGAADSEYTDAVMESKISIRAGKREESALEIMGLGTSLLLDSKQFYMHHGAAQVPLRSLIDALGGSTEWQAAERTAVVHYGTVQLEYDFIARELRVSRALFGGKQQLKAIPMPQMQLTEGTVYVPLRQSLKHLGIQVTGYIYSEPDRALQVYAKEKAFRTAVFAALTPSLYV